MFLATEDSPKPAEVEYISGESPYLGAELVQGYIKGVHSKNDP